MPRRQSLTRPAPSRTRSAGTAALLTAALALTTACGEDGLSAVDVSVPVSSGDVGAICARLEQALPATVDNGERRDTSPRSDRTAAWGEPPVLLRCGVERPTALTSTSMLNTVNGIDWLAETRDGANVFTSVGRAAYIEVVVPSTLQPPVGPLADLAQALQFVPARPEFFPTPTAEPTKPTKDPTKNPTNNPAKKKQTPKPTPAN
ncbi:DUF3515 domain-containing protein [Sporichthya polymorpha]|uniref:DUF3515 domain-containing protein n=1 Tax=Sporichthya polymorpha TaxID=35751 RepID=UPI00036CF62E|nr:DUF3515 domain-containing protein [Sporichthya polymorpha]